MPEPVKIPADIKRYLEGKVTPIEENMPHRTAELICLRCMHRYQGVWPEVTPLKKLECPNCNRVGFIITTGE